MLGIGKKVYGLHFRFCASLACNRDDHFKVLAQIPTIRGYLAICQPRGGWSGRNIGKFPKSQEFHPAVTPTKTPRVAFSLSLCDFRDVQARIEKVYGLHFRLLSRSIAIGRNIFGFGPKS